MNESDWFRCVPHIEVANASLHLSWIDFIEFLVSSARTCVWLITFHQISNGIQEKMWYMRAMVAIETPAIRVRKHWHNYATHHDKEASTSVTTLINSAIKVYASVYEPHATELGMNWCQRHSLTTIWSFCRTRDGSLNLIYNEWKCTWCRPLHCRILYRNFAGISWATWTHDDNKII